MKEIYTDTLVDQIESKFRKAQKQTPEHILFLDFDDTLATTDCKIEARNQHGVLYFTPYQFAQLDVKAYEKEGYVFHYEQFHKCPGIVPIEQNIQTGIQHLKQHGPDSVYIITARSEQAKTPILSFLHKNGLKVIHYRGVDGGDPALKSNYIASIIKENPQAKNVTFIDDSEKNVISVQKLDSIFPNVNITTYWFKKPEPAKETK